MMDIIPESRRISPTELEVTITQDSGKRTRLTMPTNPTFMLTVNEYGFYKLEYSSPMDLISKPLSLPDSHNVLLTKFLSELENGDKIKLIIIKKHDKEVQPK